MAFNEIFCTNSLESQLYKNRETIEKSTGCTSMQVSRKTSGLAEEHAPETEISV